MGKVLTDQQVDTYRRDGFLAPLDLLSTREAGAVRGRIEEIEAGIDGEMQLRFKIKAHLPFPFLCDIIAHPTMLDMVEDIIGPDILCWGSSFFFKEAHDPRFVSWHQDSTYYGLEPPDTLTAWLAVTDSTLESGCVRYVPGSHGNGILHHDETHDPKNLLSRGQTIPGVDESKAVDVTLKAGQISFHKEDVVHGSSPNRSGDRRLGFSIHYIAPHVRETKFPKASAMVLRGSDTGGSWKPDPYPKADWDPECVAFLDETLKAYHTAPEDREPAD